MRQTESRSPLLTCFTTVFESTVPCLPNLPMSSASDGAGELKQIDSRVAEAASERPSTSRHLVSPFGDEDLGSPLPLRVFLALLLSSDEGPLEDDICKDTERTTAGHAGQRP